MAAAPAARGTRAREEDHVDKIWLVDNGAGTSAETLQAVSQGDPVTVLRVPREALAQWLSPSAGHSLEQHFYVVDPIGNWMLRAPGDPEPARLKRDIDRLLRTSAGWDRAGRP